jgi:predicted  nucleic acid-binding Zn-ribbon protein
MTDKSANNDPIANALGISPATTTDIAVKNIIAVAHDDSARTDFETARSNVLTMIEEGMDAMDKLKNIAQQSQHPRAFEVYSTLLNTMLNANKQLLDMQTKIREINSADQPMNEKAKTITNNNMFVGSTSELQKMIENLKNGNDPNSGS